MGVYICPVCEGKGHVPAGFYSTNAAPTVVNTSPEICKSCGGKGVIFDSDTFINPFTMQEPYNKYLNESVTSFNSCSNCGNNDGMVYTSNPPKWRCTLDGEWHTGAYCCDYWCEQKLFNGIPIENCTRVQNVHLGVDLASKEDVEFVNDTEQSNTLD